MSGSAAIHALPPLRTVIAAHDLAARKALGQNFLLDLNLTGRIARAARTVSPDMEAGTTIEIGPGPGGLTRALLIEGAGHVVAIERDERCVAALQPLVAAAEGRLSVISADALSVDFAALGPAPRRVVANLPYNVATPLLLTLLRTGTALDALCLMFQREVADRIVAQPGDKAYGRLAVATQWHGRVVRAFDIRPEAFVPPPKVHSSVVLFKPHETAPFAADWGDLERVTAAAFGQRRKMLRASLKGIFREPEAVLSQVGIDPTARAETLPLEAFCALARALSDLG